MKQLLSMIVAAMFAAVSVSALAQDKKDDPKKSTTEAKKAPKSKEATKKADAKPKTDAKKTKPADTKKKPEEVPVKK